MNLKYFVMIAALATLVLFPYNVVAQTTVFTEELRGTGDSFPPDCAADGDLGGYDFTGGQFVTITTIKYNADGTSGFVSALSYYNNAKARGWGTYAGIDIDNDQWDIDGASAGLNIQLNNGYGENDQVVYTTYQGKGKTPSISGFSIFHLKIWADPAHPFEDPTIISKLVKSYVSCPAP